MRRRSFVSLLAPLALSFAGCADTLPGPDDTPGGDAGSLGASPVPNLPRPTPEEAKSFAASSNGLGFDLWRAAAKAPGNRALSPASIAFALGMTYGGAAGETASEMKKTLRFNGELDATRASAGKLSAALQDPKNDVKLRIANRLFGQRGFPFKKTFLDATKQSFGAPLEPMAFDTDAEGARTAINGWVEAQTEKHIRDLLPRDAVGPDTRLVLVNAIYFLADWATPFKKEDTSPRAFASPGGTHDVPTMNAMLLASYGEADHHQLLQLPYKGGAMSMLVLLPRLGTPVSALEAELSNEKLESWTKGMSAQQVIVALPKFKIEPGEPISLKTALSDLGMGRAFNEGLADFSGMVDTTQTDKRLAISDVVHKAMVAVDEKGTEAAAATGVVMLEAGAAPPPAVRFEADRPFLFLVRDNASGAVLFMGRVEDPAAA